MIEIQTIDSFRASVDEPLMRAAIELTLENHQRPNDDVTLRITDDAEISQLNRLYRDEDHATDVLSFSENYVDPETGRLYLGDIVISAEKALEQAPEHHHNLNQECAFLAIHGTLHLLGYDHEAPDEKDRMWAMQDNIFKQLRVRKIQC